MSKRTHNNNALPVVISAATLLATGLTHSAVDTDGAGERTFQEAASIELPRIRVVAPTLTALSTTPGAVYEISEEDIEQIQPRSTEDLLRRVPGIYIKREEDSAVVTNFGVRGLPAGDYKTLVLEDGVPIQPGIFVGNARYYNPRVQRMEGVEVLKGASSLRYGPNNIGGVINYLTRTPDDGLVISSRVGSWNTREATVELGGSSASRESQFGIMATRGTSDGWMDKGWDMTDVMVKAGSALGDDHFVGVKLSYYENDANISYRGYFEDAFEAGATFNPAPDDYFLTDRRAFDVNHEWNISDDMRLQTVAFWSEMSRDYWRFNVDGTTTNAEGLTVWNFTDILEGRNRDFERVGFESRLFVNHKALGVDNEAQFGLRFMQEEMHDTRPRATRAAPRDPVSLDSGPGQPALRRNRLDSADSLALYAQNRFDVSERLSVTTGLRVETYEQERKDLQQTVDRVDSFSNTEWLPGFGATFQVNPSTQLYGSVYIAFAPPLVGSVVGSDDVPTEAEKSVNVDLGMRGGSGSFTYEFTAFRMDFSNQVDPGISGIRPPHEGSALIQGMEASAGYEFGNGFGINGNLTWIPTAEFGEDRPGEAEEGNRLAYSPDWTANLTLSYRTGGLKSAVLLNYTDEVFGDGMNRTEIDPLNHMGGLIPSYYTVDLTANYDFSQHLNVFGAVRNLTDRRYIAGLRQGIYAGPERNFEVGLTYRF
ncbi:TonB-dependent receptor [Wenzhouxiangella sp. AB-CW3]|uniref:TonB-dependent receptor family protein n=1 Tax=Wenzhouxiangella sp. AB-CW3 TaxID=2771012 RepID=UPI00168B797D|nr:TonB-dependent receptor [Wenzhouxiangella sp. AB-CW3]QOC22474.1 TonB-dependent receptor [Wenzhouxiangella sp. AB-CW3]